MDISHKFMQVGIFITQDGFVAVLEEMSMPTMSPIESYGIARQNLPHHQGYGNISCSQ